MTRNSPNEAWEPDKGWSLEQWRKLLEQLVDKGLVSWKDVTATVLGQLNPSQVGTSLASNPNIKKQFPPRKTWQAVRHWLYEQDGRCANCGSRFDLQVDHITPGDNTLSKLRLLCRRCNVVRRPSHKKGGITFLSSESALMWLLFVYKPQTYEEYKKLCRKYGLTMADIRFQEAWAMAEWLKKEGKYP